MENEAFYQGLKIEVNGAMKFLVWSSELDHFTARSLDPSFGCARGAQRHFLWIPEPSN